MEVEGSWRYGFTMLGCLGRYADFWWITYG
jgi:hypothetical protein